MRYKNLLAVKVLRQQAQRLLLERIVNDSFFGRELK